jgi:paraquat-inducible protein A
MACRHCDLLQAVPALRAGSSATCPRCSGILRRAQRDPLRHGLALNIAALSLFGVACLMPLMSVSKAGMGLSADLFSGPLQLKADGVWPLSVVILIATFFAPLLKILGTLYVLLQLRRPSPSPHIRRVFVWVEKLRPWAMIEVYMLGVLVAYVKLVDIVTIDVGVAVYALAILILTMVMADAALDRHAVWEAIDRSPRPRFDAGAESRDTIGCEICGLVHEGGPRAAPVCLRCGSHLHRRKPNSLARSWAFVLAALVLYVPANVYPVLTVIQLGSGEPSTILGGVEELVVSHMYPLAALVFFASILVPVLKVVSLMILLVSAQMGWSGRLRDRTRLYRIVNVIGRWSMIDIFMISILVSLVHFGAVVMIAPGFGAVCFASVVILTMFAAESFDPRLMWDNAAKTKGKSL